MLRDVDRQDVSREVVDINLDVEFTEIGARMGRVPGGYVDEHEARWQMLEELLDPFLEDIARRWRLGFENAAIELAVGVLHGLYELREADEHTLIGWGATVGRVRLRDRGEGGRLPGRETSAEARACRRRVMLAYCKHAERAHP